MRAPRLLGALCFAVLGVVACGRTGLDDFDVFAAGGPTVDADGGADSHSNSEGGGACNGQTCKGCCTGGQCVAGVAPTACGSAGTACVDCTASGLGCAEMNGGGVCEGTPTCDLQTCPTGCCVEGRCSSGTSDTACGSSAEACQSCVESDRICQGGSCKLPPQICNAQTCPTGCCSNGICVDGSQDDACGVSGAACVDCSPQSQICSAGVCAPRLPCSGQSCAGCCDPAGICQAGFLDTQCGDSGGACDDCTSTGKLCDTAKMPRACVSQVTVCPAPYGSCPTGVATPHLAPQHVCSTVDLANAHAACTNGAHTAACNAFFQFETVQDPSCAQCLAPFDYDFAEQEGVFLCAAPFATAACNRSTGCAFDCESKACEQCPVGSVPQCRAAVIAPGECLAYFQQANCDNVALAVPAAAFCVPATYAVNFGGWLEGVGGHYCGP